MKPVQTTYLLAQVRNGTGWKPGARFMCVTQKERKTLYVVIQEGGSSVEHYPTLYNTEQDALDAQHNHQEATYRATAPIPVEGIEENGVFRIDEHELLDLCERVRAAEYE